MSRHRAHTEPAQSEIEPDTAGEVAVTDMLTAPQTAPRSGGEPTTTSPTHPSGKLGVIIDEIATPAGATIGDLVASTGWQPHTIRAAFSRLRRRGFPIVLATGADGRKAYRLDVLEG